jgi:hypothetical protein
MKYDRVEKIRSYQFYEYSFTGIIGVIFRKGEM